MLQQQRTRINPRDCRKPILPFPVARYVQSVVRRSRAHKRAEHADLFPATRRGMIKTGRLWISIPAVGPGWKTQARRDRDPSDQTPGRSSPSKRYRAQRGCWPEPRTLSPGWSSLKHIPSRGRGSGCGIPWVFRGVLHVKLLVEGVGEVHAVDGTTPLCPKGRHSVPG